MTHLCSRTIKLKRRESQGKQMKSKNWLTSQSMPGTLQDGCLQCYRHVLTSGICFKLVDPVCTDCSNNWGLVVPKDMLAVSSFPYVIAPVPRSCVESILSQL